MAGATPDGRHGEGLAVIIAGGKDKNRHGRDIELGADADACHWVLPRPQVRFRSQVRQSNLGAFYCSLREKDPHVHSHETKPSSAPPAHAKLSPTQDFSGFGSYAPMQGRPRGREWIRTGVLQDRSAWPTLNKPAVLHQNCRLPRSSGKALSLP